MTIKTSKKAQLLCTKFVKIFEDYRKAETTFRYDMTVYLMEEFELGSEELLEQELEKFYSLQRAQIEAMHERDRELLGSFLQTRKRL